MLDFGSSLAKSRATVIELVGDVGAGKTTLVRGLAKGLGIIAPVTSPSFTISKSYALPNNEGRLIHYDFYRLDDPGLMSEDLRDNLANPNNIIVIEWGESVSNLLPENHTIIRFYKNNNGSRNIVIENSKSNTSKKLTKESTEHPKNQTSNNNPTGFEDKYTTLAKTNSSNSFPKNPIRLYLDTSSSMTILKLNDREYHHDFGHDLAEKLLSWIHDKLQENNANWHSISEITFMSGPGSFTGLRIGAAIVNTLAHELEIPLFDHHGQRLPIIIPEYGQPANISQPKK